LYHSTLTVLYNVAHKITKGVLFPNLLGLLQSAKNEMQISESLLNQISAKPVECLWATNRGMIVAICTLEGGIMS
jgi:predicted metal-binding protein